MSKRVRGESRGQHEPTWRRIRGLIDKYPNDSSILKELIQNADDGGARSITIMLDLTRIPCCSMPRPEMELLLGPAILAFNDAPFRDSDFDNLENLAHSGKVEDASKIGRYGLGFNAVYNVTDYPLLLSAGKLWLLDPCRSIAFDTIGGEMWSLQELHDHDVAGILDLFSVAGYQQGSTTDYQSTAFRLPLRNQEHVRRNGDKISDHKFRPEDFKKVLVDGLAGIAHELLLFLKHLECVECCVRQEDGKTEHLLKIRVNNLGEVQAGRGETNRYLKKPFDQLLDSIQREAMIESTFEMEVVVARAGKRDEHSNWLVTSGLYAGEGNVLTSLSEALVRHKERGVPHAGVAVCMRRDGKEFQKIDGKVFCYLPIADRDYSGRFPVHIHGAFSLDDGRTSLTGHREDEHGKQALIAKWNDVLLEQAVAKAFGTVVRSCVQRITGHPPSVTAAASIYQLFPPKPSSQLSHMRQLAEAACRELAQGPVFLDSLGTWKTCSEMLDVPDDLDLRKCLKAEDFSFPEPSLPTKVREALEEVEGLPEELSCVHITEHFSQSEGLEVTIKECPFPGLRSRATITALAVFLARKELDDWSCLPLALCLDGMLRSFPGKDDDPLWVGTVRQHRIFDQFKEWFLDPLFCRSTGIESVVQVGCEPMSIDAVLVNLETVVLDVETGESRWNPTGASPPNAKWLISVIEEILSVDGLSESESQKELLLQTPLIPGDDGLLHEPGTPTTPLLVQNRHDELSTLLKTLGVRHYVLNPKNPLTPWLTKLRDQVGMVRDLTPADLLDTLAAQLAELGEHVDQWRSEQTVGRLIGFFSGTVAKLSKERQAVLRSLPIWTDSNGDYGPVVDDSYLPGDFPAPRISTMVRILAGEDQWALLKELGVGHITRGELLQQSLLPLLTDLDNTGLVEVARWIRDEWNHLAEEFGGESKLQDILRDQPLLIDDHGEGASPSDLFNPEARKVVSVVLGDEAKFPCSKSYPMEDPLWRKFFQNLDLSQQLEAWHLAAFIMSRLNAVNQTGLTEAVEADLETVFRHLAANWAGVREQTVADTCGVEVPFLQFIQKTRWIPAARGKDMVSRFGAWSEPERKLYAPSELVAFSQGACCASVTPLAPALSREMIAEVRAEMGIRWTPSHTEILGHLEQVLVGYQEANPGESEMEHWVRVFGMIYRKLGECAGTESQTSPVQDLRLQEEIRRRFSETPCILVARARRLYRPIDVYAVEVGNLRPIKESFRSDELLLEKGLKLLGRLDQPGLSDLAAGIVCYTEDGNQCEAEAGFRAVIQCLRRLARMLDDTDEQDGPDIVLPAADRQFVRPEALVVADDPSLRHLLEDHTDRVLHSDVPVDICRYYRLNRLSDVRAVPSEYQVAPDNHPAWHVACRWQTLLRSQEFTMALVRVMKHQGTVARRNDLLWLGAVEVELVERLRCVYQLEMIDGYIMEFPNKGASVVFDKSHPPSGRFLVSSDGRDGPSVDDFLDELVRQLDDQAPANERILLRLIEGEPSALEGILDRLRVQSSGNGVEEAGPWELAAVDQTYSDEDDTSDLVDDGSISEDSNSETEDVSATSGEAYERQREDKEIDGDNADGVAEGETDDSDDSSNGTVDENSKDGRVHKGGAAKRTGGGHSTGGGSSGDSSKKTKPGYRQQDGLWMSRAFTREQADEFRARNDDHDDEGGRNHKIGKAAVGWVLQYEATQGRKARSMPHENPGFDVLSKKGRVIERFIEVKGIDGEWGKAGVPLSNTQLFYARQPDEFDGTPVGDRFWLYVVEHALDPAKVKIHMIQNPAERANQFRFDCGWKDTSITCDGFVPTVPKAGMRLRIEGGEGDFEEGTIRRVYDNGQSQLTLTVAFEGNPGPAKTIIYNPTRHLLID
jgi:hypothetical protein